MTLWLWVLAGSGALSLLALLVDEALGLPIFGGPAGFLGVLAVLGLPWAWIAWAATPRVPGWTVLPPSVAGVWVATGAMPLPLYVSWTLAQVVGPAVLLGTAGLILGRLWRIGASPALDTGVGTGPVRRWGHTLQVGALGLVGAVPACVAWLLVCVHMVLSWGTGGFVGLGWGGLEVAQRTFVRGEDRVDLVALAHIGAAGTYEAIEAGVPLGGVVLAEGVTDRTGVLTGGLDYSPFASTLGLVAQPHALGARHGEVVPADVDISDLSARTRELIGLVAQIYGADGVPARLAAWQAYQSRLEEDPEGWLRTFWADVVDLRNAHVLGVLDETLVASDVVVIPWGAIHMKGIAEGVRSRGFVEQAVTWRTLVPWPLTTAAPAVTERASIPAKAPISAPL